jgi:hypothetical protein
MPRPSTTAKNPVSRAISLVLVYKAPFTNSSYAFSVQGLFNLARDNILHSHIISPVISFVVGWLVGLVGWFTSYLYSKDGSSLFLQNTGMIVKFGNPKYRTLNSHFMKTSNPATLTKLSISLLFYRGMLCSPASHFITGGNIDYNGFANMHGKINTTVPFSTVPYVGLNFKAVTHL